MKLPQQTRSTDRVESICKLVKNAFSILPAGKIQLSEILAGSNIKRTSFYRYFDSVDDAVSYIIGVSYNNLKNNIRQCYTLVDILKEVKSCYSDLPVLLVQYAEHNYNCGIEGNQSTSAVVGVVVLYARELGIVLNSELLGMLVREAMIGKVHVNSI